MQLVSPALFLMAAWPALARQVFAHLALQDTIQSGSAALFLLSIFLLLWPSQIYWQLNSNSPRTNSSEKLHCSWASLRRGWLSTPSPPTAEVSSQLTSISMETLLIRLFILQSPFSLQSPIRIALAAPRVLSTPTHLQPRPPMPTVLPLDPLPQRAPRAHLCWTLTS